MSPMVRVEGRLIGDSPAAVHIRQGVRDFWIPKSQIKYSLRNVDESYECHVPAWIAEKRDDMDYEEID